MLMPGGEGSDGAECDFPKSCAIFHRPGGYVRQAAKGCININT